MKFSGRYFFTLLCIRKNIALVLFFLILSVSKTWGTDYYQRQSGNWNSSQTWTTSSSWNATANTGTYPKAGDNVYLYNNGNLATITLTADAECANLYFNGSEPACVIAMGDYDLIVDSYWTTNWSSNATITQEDGYLQVNGSISMFRTAKTISNFRVGSSSFTFTQTNQITLTVSSYYDHYCYTSTVPTGINASSATKLNATPCSSSLSATALADFGSVCPNTTVGPDSFIITGLALTSANVTVAALSGFTYSTTSNGTYSTSLSLTNSGLHYSQTIYVKFTPTAVASYSGNIVVGGGGASSINVAAVGSGSNSVSPTVTSPTATNVLTTSATLGGNITIEGCTSNSIIERGIYYSTTSGFADGAGTKVSETGTFSTGVFTIDVSGLTSSTVYYYKAFATNSNGTGYSVQGTFNNVPKTYYSYQTGNWSSSSTWSTGSCGSTTNEGTYPTAVDNVVICQSHTITVNASDLSCYNLTMTAYAGQLVLNYDFTIYGDLAVAQQSYVSVGTHDLVIEGGFTNTANLYNSRIDYSTGNVTIGGDITVGKSGYEPFNCSSTGWLTMTGTSKTFSVSDNIIVPRFRQPSTGFTKGGNKTLTISTIFDQNCGPEQTSNKFSVTGTTINATCTNTITTGTISGSPFCVGSSVSVPFTISGTFNSGNVFTAQLSDASGSFSSPVSIGTLTQTSAGTISGTIPSGSTAGTAYRIRVIGSSPSTTGSDNGTNLTVSALPQGSLAANGPFCISGTGQLTWTSTAGTSPFTVIYNDGTSNRTQTNVSSGTSFNVYTNPVTSTSTYTLASVTSNSGCVRTSGFTVSSATINVYDISALVSLESVDNDCPQLDPSLGFNPDNSGPYDPGSTEIVFRVTRQNSTSNWSFVYEISGGTLNHTFTPDNPSSGTINVDAASDYYDMIFYIYNVPGSAQTILFNVTSITDTDDSCSRTYSTNSLSCIIKAMPVIGAFN